MTLISERCAQYVTVDFKLQIQLMNKAKFNLFMIVKNQNEIVYTKTNYFYRK